MRLRSLIPVLLAGCGTAEPSQPVFVDDFISRSSSAKCSSIAAPADVYGLTSLSAVGDTAVLALYGRDREIVLVGTGRAEIRRIRFAREGPTGVHSPVSAVLAGDSVFYVADQAGRSLKRLDLGGGDHGADPLPFPPQYLATTKDALLLTPLVIGRQPRRLAFLFQDHVSRELPVPTASLEDVGVNALANHALVATYPDGAAAVVHQFLLPLAYRFDPVGRGPEPIGVPLPMPDGLRGAVGRPPETVGDQAMRSISPTAIAIAADAATGDLLYLVRSGRRIDGRYEKALIRVDRGFRYLGSVLLEMNAVHLAYAGATGQAVIVDEEDRWYDCPTP